MIQNKLIIIPFGLNLNWVADYEKQTAQCLSKKNFVLVILFSEGLTFRNFFVKLVNRKKTTLCKKNNRLFYITPLYVLPFNRFTIVKKINYKITGFFIDLLLYLKFRYKKKVLWIFTSAIEIIDYFNRSLFTIYDCVDLPCSLDKSQEIQKKAEENKVLKRANIIFATSTLLYKYLHKKNPNSYYVSQGFDLSLFSKKTTNRCPFDLKKIPKPRIVFLGNINYRLDFNFIEKLAKTTPNYSYVLIGPLNPDYKQDIIANTQEGLKKILKLPNIYLLDRKNKKIISKYIKHTDIGFIPYNIKQGFNKYCYPMKLLEFFFFGKPIISTPIPAISELKPYAVTIKSARKAKLAIEKILINGWGEELIRKQLSIAINHSWDNKILKISRILVKKHPQYFC